MKKSYLISLLIVFSLILAACGPGGNAGETAQTLIPDDLETLVVPGDSTPTLIGTLDDTQGPGGEVTGSPDATMGAGEGTGTPAATGDVGTPGMTQSPDVITATPGGRTGTPSAEDVETGLLAAVLDLPVTDANGDVLGEVDGIIVNIVGDEAAGPGTGTDVPSGTPGAGGTDVATPGVITPDAGTPGGQDDLGTPGAGGDDRGTPGVGDDDSGIPGTGNDLDTTPGVGTQEATPDATESEGSGGGLDPILGTPPAESTAPAGAVTVTPDIGATVETETPDAGGTAETDTPDATTPGAGTETVETDTPGAGTETVDAGTPGAGTETAETSTPGTGDMTSTPEPGGSALPSGELPFIQYVRIEPDDSLGIADDQDLIVPWQAFNTTSPGGTGRIVALEIERDVLIGAPTVDEDDDLNVNEPNWDDDFVSYWSDQDVSIPVTGPGEAGTRVWIDDDFGDFNALNASGDDIGDVEDFVINLHNGELIFALLETSDDQPLGERVVPVPMALVEWTLEDDGQEVEELIIHADQEQLQDAPYFENISALENAPEGWQQEIEAYWASLMR